MKLVRAIGPTFSVTRLEMGCERGAIDRLG